MDPADFYTGIVAELYSPLKSTSQSWEPYAEFIEAAGQPALELGCGEGEPLLELLRRGYDVDGVDSSQDMLDRLQAGAADFGLTADLFCQRMEELDLDRKYRSIFLAGPTITLLADDSIVLAALVKIREHLAEGGTALVPLFVPSPTARDRFGEVKETTDLTGAVLRISTVGQTRDDETRTQRTLLRYEKHADGGATVEDRLWLPHWHTPEGFENLAGRAGLRVTATDERSGRIGMAGSEWTVLLQPVDARR